LIFLGSSSSPSKGLNSLFSPAFTFFMTFTHLASRAFFYSKVSLPVCFKPLLTRGFLSNFVFCSFYFLRASLLASNLSLRSSKLSCLGRFKNLSATIGAGCTWTGLLYSVLYALRGRLMLEPKAWRASIDFSYTLDAISSVCLCLANCSYASLIL
jgi:hypothetical protein